MFRSLTVLTSFLAVPYLLSRKSPDIVFLVVGGRFPSWPRSSNHKFARVVPLHERDNIR
jgi:hypothetical protein